MNAIEFRNLRKTYSTGLSKPQAALKDFSLDIPEASIFGFVGANGAGKTTLIKILMGIQWANQGSFTIFGNKPELPEIKAKIGFLPERPYLQEMLSAEEFLNFHRNLYGKYFRPGLTNRDLLSLVGLSAVGAKKIKDYSKGMQQRLGIAQALVNNPDIVILDEPMSGLDPLGRRDVRDIILTLGKQGKTVFFSTHILSDIESLCSHIAFIEQGEKRYSGPLKALLEENSQRKEIVFQGISDTKLSSEPSLAQAKRMQSTFSTTSATPTETQKIIEKIWSLGGEVISLQTIHKDLESTLFSKLERIS